MNIYFGSEKVKKINKKDGWVTVTTDKTTDYKMSETLYDMCKQTKKSEQEQSLQDKLYFIVALKLLYDMGDYGFKCGQIPGIVQHLSNLATNRMEQEIGKRFDCHSSMEIPINDVLVEGDLSDE